MAKNKNRKAQAQQARKQRRNEKQKKRQARAANQVAVGIRLKKQLTKAAPEVWAGEQAADAAVFDDREFQELSSDVQSDVMAVREALKLACALQGNLATAQLAGIPRSSPLSEWRLLIRGLTLWLDDDLPSAKVIWNRLDPERRPGRIATAIVAAPLPDLETAVVAAPGLSSALSAEQPDANGAGGTISSAPVDTSLLSDAGIKNRLDNSLLQSARRLRRVRIDRVAIRMALTGATAAEEDSELLIGPDKIKWLRNFSQEFGSTEPALVSALQQTALLRAYHQSYIDVFSKAAADFKGPDHDRQNELLSFFFCNRDSSIEDQTSRHFQNYVNSYLKNDQRLPQPLRQALISECCLLRANQLMSGAANRPSFLQFKMPNNSAEIERLLKKAISAYPGNRNAFQDYVESLKERLNGREMTTAAKREPVLKQLAAVMKSWAEGLPDDVEPRLWLVDHLLETGKLDDALEFIEWLKVARQDDPQVRALPWKWQVLNAARLSRRKSDLTKVPEKLKVVEAEWPTWLSKDWHAYLHAAFLLRSGDKDGVEQQRAQICEQQKRERDCPRDACMMLAAAQTMNVPAADLKPLRTVVDTAVKNVKTISLEQLMDLGEFYWDLHRAQISYPAYRMHGGKFGREFLNRVRKGGNIVRTWVNLPAFKHSLLWTSEHRFWPANDDFAFPKNLLKAAVQDPLVAAALVNSVTKARHCYDIDRVQESLTFLGKARLAESEPFYFDWFKSLIEQVERQRQELENSRSRFGFGGILGEMARAMGFGMGDDDDDELDDDDDDDDECDCEVCVAARARAANLLF